MLIVLILTDQAAVSLLSVNFCIQDVSFFPYTCEETLCWPQFLQWHLRSFRSVSLLWYFDQGSEHVLFILAVFLYA